MRLVDEEPRPGAEGAQVAFIHPSAAHGVLVELKQPPPPQTELAPRRMAWGDLRLTSVHDGLFRLDGGAMFGVVPRPLWEKKAPPDDRNRIQLAHAAARRRSGVGPDDRSTAAPATRWTRSSGTSTRSIAGATSITRWPMPACPPTRSTWCWRRTCISIISAARRRATGGASSRGSANARYLIRAAEWEDATHPHERNRASYLQDDFVPLKDAGVVDFFEGDSVVKPGVRVVRTGGHTGQHQIVFLESAGKTAVFTADLIPTTAHVQDPWIMGYDLFPMETLAVKKRFIRDAIDHEYLIFFEHDPVVAAGYIREKDGRRFVEQVL